MSLTLAQLQAICTTHGGQERCAAFIAPLNQYMPQFGISTPARQAAFMAQCLHECAEFHYLHELASGSAYEGRLDLGNTRPGDGVRYKGRGLIQITGRHNYAEAGVALGQDFITHPERLELPGQAVAASCWWWQQHGLNTLADSGDFLHITRVINGGSNGLADRSRYWVRAKAVLGVSP
jgi:putative chitinase